MPCGTTILLHHKAIARRRRAVQVCGTDCYRILCSVRGVMMIVLILTTFLVGSSGLTPPSDSTRLGAKPHAPMRRHSPRVVGVAPGVWGGPGDVINKEKSHELWLDLRGHHVQFAQQALMQLFMVSQM